MSRVISKKLGLSVLLLMVALVTGCGGGSGGTTSYKDKEIDKTDGDNQARIDLATNALLKMKEQVGKGDKFVLKRNGGSVVHSNVDGAIYPLVNSTKNTLDFKQVAGGQDVVLSIPDDIVTVDDLSPVPVQIDFDDTTITTNAKAYGKSLDTGVFVAVNAVTDYGVEDKDYLSFGLWTYVPNDSSATPEIGFYTNGGDPFTKAHFAGLTGTANYSGIANGLYVNSESKLYDVEGNISLQADFENKGITGHVKDISFYDVLTKQKDETFGEYEVILKKADITDVDGGFFTGDDITLVSSDSDGSQYTGQWGGQFYGNDDTDPATHPRFATGNFSVTSDAYNDAFVGFFATEVVVPVVP